MKYKLCLGILTAFAVPMISVLPALACDLNDTHSNLHTQLDSQHNQIHQLLNAGVIAPQDHAILDSRLSAEHAAVHNQSINPQLSRNGYYNGYSNNDSNGYGNGVFANNIGYNTGFNNYNNGVNADYLGNGQGLNSYDYNGGSVNNIGYNLGLNGGYNNFGSHRQEHRAFNAAHRDIHKLVNNGIISPQEHAAFDAQLTADHAQADAYRSYQTNGNNFQNARNWFSR